MMEASATGPPQLIETAGSSVTCPSQTCHFCMNKRAHPSLTSASTCKWDNQIFLALSLFLLHLYLAWLSLRHVKGSARGCPDIAARMIVGQPCLSGSLQKQDMLANHDCRVWDGSSNFAWNKTTRIYFIIATYHACNKGMQFYQML